MDDVPLPHQNQIDVILAELDSRRQELERRDRQLIDEAVQRLVDVGLSDHRARQIVRAHGKLKLVVP